MLQTSTKGVQILPRLAGEDVPLGIVQELKFDQTTKWFMYNRISLRENEMHLIF